MEFIRKGNEQLMVHLHQNTGFTGFVRSAFEMIVLKLLMIILSLTTNQHLIFIRLILYNMSYNQKWKCSIKFKKYLKSSKSVTRGKPIIIWLPDLLKILLRFLCTY